MKQILTELSSSKAGLMKVMTEMFVIDGSG
jgi:hypothetical protein